ncbi:MAG TPA: glycosyltransferase family 4 protein [Kofleriaceae bacterium]
MSAPLRMISYSSGYQACGVADYNRHLTAALPPRVDCTTIHYPTIRVGRHHPRELLALRREYSDLAAMSDAYDVVLMHWATRYWNGSRPVENTFPLFAKRIRRPIVMVLHEWPIVAPERHAGALPVRLAKRALTAAWSIRDIGIRDYQRWFARDMFHRMAHIIVHSSELRDRLLAAGVAAERISVERFPLHELPRPAWSSAQVRERFALHGKRALLLLGHPVPRKGFDLAVRALAKLPSDVVLVLVCSESSPQERQWVNDLREVARDAGVADRLITPGFLDDAELAAMFQAVDLALSPFREVTGSSSLAHFLAARLPVIASDLPPIRETAEQGAGLRLFTAGNADALASEISTALAKRQLLDELRSSTSRYAAATTFNVLAGKLRQLAETARHG